jgi:hypothetical protein
MDRRRDLCFLDTRCDEGMACTAYGDTHASKARQLATILPDVALAEVLDTAA